jgi:hypothetical protein
VQEPIELEKLDIDTEVPEVPTAANSRSRLRSRVSLMRNPLTQMALMSTAMPSLTPQRHAKSMDEPKNRRTFSDNAGEFHRPPIHALLY